MDAETQKRWDAWARSIARKEARRTENLVLETMRDCLHSVIDDFGGRIVELERELKALKERQPAPSEEWPLRAITGGKR